MLPLGLLSLYLALAPGFLTGWAEPVENRMNAPVITNLKFEPSSAAHGTRFLIRIQVFDRQGSEDVVPVLFLLRGGWELVKTPLYDDGTHGDQISDDGFYAGFMTIPPTAAYGNHWFLVYLYDKANLRSNLLIHEIWVKEDQEKI